MTSREEIEALTNGYLSAFKDKDAQACADFYTDDAIYIACGSQPIRGRSAIKSLHENIIEEGFQILNIETTDVEISGNLAFIIQNLKGNQGDSVAMLALKREQNGQWRVCAEAEVS
jgi:uncharacterized protein (TIGR02246 family)